MTDHKPRRRTQKEIERAEAEMREAFDEAMRQGAPPPNGNLLIGVAAINLGVRGMGYHIILVCPHGKTELDMTNDIPIAEIVVNAIAGHRVGMAKESIECLCIPQEWTAPRE